MNRLTNSPTIAQSQTGRPVARMPEDALGHPEIMKSFPTYCNCFLTFFVNSFLFFAGGDFSVFLEARNISKNWKETPASGPSSIWKHATDISGCIPPRLAQGHWHPPEGLAAAQ